MVLATSTAEAEGAVRLHAKPRVLFYAAEAVVFIVVRFGLCK